VGLDINDIPVCPTRIPRAGEFLGLIR